MSEISQEFPEISPNQPSKLLRDSLTMRMAYEIANADMWTENATFETRSQAYISGLKVAEDLDRLAIDDKLFHRQVIISGPSVSVPDVTVMSENGSTIISPTDKKRAPESVIFQLYQEHQGEFYGFGIVVKEVGDINHAMYTPQLAYVMQTGKRIYTPVISGQLSAYGLVKDTNIRFIEDEIILNRQSNIDEIGELSKGMDELVVSQIDLFMTCLDRTLTSENFTDLISSLEIIVNYGDDDTTTELTDAMLTMLKQYLSVAPSYDHIKATASYNFDDSLDINNGPALRCSEVENMKAKSETFSLNAQDIVFLPIYGRVGADGGWDVSQQKVAYFVYNKNGEDIYVPARSSEVIIHTED